MGYIIFLYTQESTGSSPVPSQVSYEMISAAPEKKRISESII